jgi:copper chaperone CopZ
MRTLIVVAAVGMLALTVQATGQESKKQPAKGELTNAVYWVPNQHCLECATALEGSLKKVAGIKSTAVNFPTKWATVEFDESVISAQEVSRAMFQAPHAMGANMKYGGFLMLSVPDAKDKATQAKATTALGKVEGVAKAMYYPQTKAVAIQFTDKGKVTSTELIKALEDAGLKAAQFSGKAKK